MHIDKEYILLVQRCEVNDHEEHVKCQEYFLTIIILTIIIIIIENKLQLYY
jgi:hypothetical protein